MTTTPAIEELLRYRPPGWWEQLRDVIPELNALAETPQPPEHHAEGDVAKHTRLAVEACPDDCDPDLLWVALLHDIGKPATTQMKPEGKITAHGHDKLGAVMTEAILSRLAMPPERVNRIVWVVRHHIFHHAWQLNSPDEVTKKQLRYIQHEDFPLLLEFLRIDSLASQGNPNKMKSYEFYRALWKKLISN